MELQMLRGDRCDIMFLVFVKTEGLKIISPGVQQLVIFISALALPSRPVVVRTFLKVELSDAAS